MSAVIVGGKKIWLGYIRIFADITNVKAKAYLKMKIGSKIS